MEVFIRSYICNHLAVDRGEVLQPDATYAMPLGGEAYTRKGSNPLLGQDAVGIVVNRRHREYELFF